MSKVALVTGSAKGIGAALIKELAKNGYDVVINYNTSESLAKELELDIKNNYKVNVTSIKASIKDEEQIKSMLDIIINKFGKLDLLINNAAISLDSPLEEKTKDEFMEVLETNVVGTFLMTKYTSKYVKTVINISSTDSIDTYNELDIDYSASKAAINSLTKSMAYSLPNINIFAVLLKWTNTEAIKEMDKEYLNSELKRTKQDSLYEPNEVALEIINLLNKDIKSGSIIRLGGYNEN